MQKIIDQLRSPEFWFASVVVALITNIAAAYIVRYLATARSAQNILSGLTAAHAVLTEGSWLVAVIITPLQEPIDGVPVLKLVTLLVSAIGIPMGILRLARWSRAGAVAQLTTFATIFGLAIFKAPSWSDIIPVYGSIALVSSGVVALYLYGYRFLTFKAD